MTAAPDRDRADFERFVQEVLENDRRATELIRRCTAVSLRRAAEEDDDERDDPNPRRDP